jgi:hypothetical protein
MSMRAILLLVAAGLLATLFCRSLKVKRLWKRVIAPFVGALLMFIYIQLAGNSDERMWLPIMSVSFVVIEIPITLLFDFLIERFKKKP